MPYDDNLTHESVLQKIHEAIDMPPDIHETVIKKYQALGAWLDRSDSNIKPFEPFVAPQGSVLLGTANRPVGKNEEYDVDIICRLLTRKLEITQSDLKQAVGREIQAYASAHDMNHEPEDNRRCWTLHYADDHRFHMDILPCLPDAERYRRKLMESGYQVLADNSLLTSEAIAITDKTHPNYKKLSDDWPTSNPLGFAAWFFERMAERVLAEKRNLVRDSELYDKVEDVPNHEVKTTLQKAIQLLKRHRDTMFADDPEHKPISIIITTLAARAYGNEASLVEALSIILQTMENFIEERNGISWVANPVNPDENFADKWVEVPERKAAFERWLSTAKRDFGAYLRGAAPENVPQALRDRLGEEAEKVIHDELGLVAAAAPAIISGSAEGRAEKLVADIQSQRSGTKPWRGYDE